MRKVNQERMLKKQGISWRVIEMGIRWAMQRWPALEDGGISDSVRARHNFLLLPGLVRADIDLTPVARQPL